MKQNQNHSSQVLKKAHRFYELRYIYKYVLLYLSNNVTLHLKARLLIQTLANQFQELGKSSVLHIVVNVLK